MINLIRVSPPSTVVVCLAIFLGVARGVPAQGTTPTSSIPDVTRLGPQVGATVPPFSLPDQDGAMRTLASLHGPQGLMLVFFRSADW